MAGDKIGRGDEAGLADGAWPKAQVRHGHGTGFLGVVLEVALGVVWCILANDLDPVLVGADGAIGAQAKEHGPHHIVAFDVKGRVIVYAGMGHVVVDADGEVVLGLVFLHLVKETFDHGRGEFLAGQAISTADHADLARPVPSSAMAVRMSW